MLMNFHLQVNAQLLVQGANTRKAIRSTLEDGRRIVNFDLFSGFIFFYWSIFNLQCHLKYYCIVKWFSYVCVYVYTYTHTLEKEMATQSSILAWRIPETEEPGGLLSMESHRVGHDCSNLATAVYILFYVLFIVVYHRILNTVLCALN